MTESFLTYRNKRWYWTAIVTAVLLISSYLVYRTKTTPHGGTMMGLGYGILGTALIVVLMGLGIRKRCYANGPGTVRGWTSAHIYLGLLTLLIIPLHAGFKFRFDIHTLAFLLLAIVVLSGIVGVVLYVVIPPRLTKLESIIQADKIDTELNNLLNEMRTLAKNKSDAFVAVYQEELQRLTTMQNIGWRLLIRPPKADVLTTKAEEMARRVARIPPEEHAAFQSLSKLILYKAQLESNVMAQMKLRNALQAWLYIHVPVSIAMVIAVVLHVTAVFYY